MRTRTAAGREPEARAAQAQDETHAQQTGLATALRAEHRGEAAGPGKRDHAVGEPVTAEEQLGIARLETSQPPVRGHRVLVLGARLCRGLGGRLTPTSLPLLRIAAAGTDVGGDDRQGGLPLTAGPCDRVLTPCPVHCALTR